MTCGIYATKTLLFFIGKAYSIDTCEMANVLTCLATYYKHKLYSYTNIET